MTARRSPAVLVALALVLALVALAGSPAAAQAPGEAPEAPCLGPACATVDLDVEPEATGGPDQTEPPTTVAPTDPPATPSDPPTTATEPSGEPGTEGADEGDDGRSTDALIDDPGTTASEAVEEATKQPGDNAFEEVAVRLGEAAAWSVDAQYGAITGSFRPSVDDGWFSSSYQAMLGFATVLLVPLLLIALGQSVMRRDPGLALRAVGYVPVAYLGATLAVVATQALVGLTDAMSDALIGGGGAGALDDDVTLEGAKALVVGLVTGDSGLPVLLGLVLGSLLLVASLGGYLFLLAREATIYVALFFAPIALAGLVWPTTAHMARGLARRLVALILSKFVIVAVVVLGSGALEAFVGDAGGDRARIGSALVAVVVLLIAAGSPLVLMRLVPGAETVGGDVTVAGAGGGSVGSRPLTDSVSRIMASSRAQSGVAPGGGLGGGSLPVYTGVDGASEGDSRARPALVRDRATGPTPPPIAPASAALGNAAAPLVHPANGSNGANGPPIGVAALRGGRREHGEPVPGADRPPPPRPPVEGGNLT